MPTNSFFKDFQNTQFTKPHTQSRFLTEMQTRSVTRSIFPVGKHLHATSYTPDQAIANEFCSKNASHFVEIGGKSGITGQTNYLQIAVIHTFCETIRNTLELHHDRSIIVCPADSSFDSLSHVCQLCGAYLLLCEGLDLDHVVKAFTNLLAGCPPAYNTNVVNCWAALGRARDLGWLSETNEEENEAVLDVEMACHYALGFNGNIHVLVPGKLLLFPTPAALLDGQSWADTSEPEQPTVRHFSAAFLATLLADLDVSSVACLDRTDENDADAFRACGLDVHDLALDPRRPALLPAMDHLLAVSRAAPGPTALFPGRGCAGGGRGAECVESLAAAWLIARYGFGGGAAAAWVRIMCPALRAEIFPGSEAAGPALPESA